MGPRKCEVCEESQSKYKCPTCLVPYCSLACFRKHKENLCRKSPALVQEESTAEVHTERSFQVDEQSSVVSKEQLQSVAESREIQDALKDGGLRKLIQKIDSSKDPADELDKAMEVQAFREFTDKIQSIISPQESVVANFLSRQI